MPTATRTAPPTGPPVDLAHEHSVVDRLRSDVVHAHRSWLPRWNLVRRWSRLPRWATPVAVASIALAGCVALAVMDPARRGELSPGCPFRTLTGWDCPGCGATRAVYALTQGHFLRAVDHNVLVVALLPLLAWAWAGWLRQTLGRRHAPPTLPPRVSMGLAMVISVFWVGRNLPGLEWLGSMATWSLGA